MANSRGVPPTTPFSRAFAVALREVMAERSVTQTKVAQAIHRDQTFVSERTSGKRPCDTDIIAGVAEVAGTTPQAIVRDVLGRIPNARVVTVAAAGTRHASRQRPRRAPQD